MEKRDRMIAIFGHDLRGLLNALTVNAEFLLVRREGVAAVEDARNVRLTIGRMDQLITRLLDSVKLNSNGLEIVSRPLDAAALVREAVGSSLPSPAPNLSRSVSTFPTRRCG